MYSCSVLFVDVSFLLYSTNALKQLKALANQPVTTNPTAQPRVSLSRSGIPDCCICLFGVSVHQALFIAPCSHVFHYKCIRPMLLMHHPGFSCPLCRTFANLEEDVEIDAEDHELGQDVDTDGAEGGSGGSSGENAVPAAQVAANPRASAMDIDMPMGTPTGANEAVAAGAETEVERDFAPNSMRRRGNNTNGSTHANQDLRFGSHSVSPVQHGIAGVPEDADEYLSAASDELLHQLDLEHDETDELHPLPALPVPTPRGALPVQSNSSYGLGNPAASAPAQMQGMSIQRPMSVPLSSPSRPGGQPQTQAEGAGGFRRMSPLDDNMSDDGDGEGEGEDDLSNAVRRAMGASIGVTVGGDGNASGSSAGEGGGAGLIGIGEKRKR